MVKRHLAADGLHFRRASPVISLPHFLSIFFKCSSETCSHIITFDSEWHYSEFVCVSVCAHALAYVCCCCSLFLRLVATTSSRSSGSLFLGGIFLMDLCRPCSVALVKLRGKALKFQDQGNFPCESRADQSRGFVPVRPGLQFLPTWFVGVHPSSVDEATLQSHPFNPPPPSSSFHSQLLLSRGSSPGIRLHTQL